MRVAFADHHEFEEVVDNVYWTDAIAGAAQNHATQATDQTDIEREIWLLGTGSDRSKQALTGLGFSVLENVAAMMVAPSS